MVLPSAAEANHAGSFPNGHLSPLAGNVITADDISSDSESALSDIEPPRIESSTPSSSKPDASSQNDNADVDTLQSSDAENEAASEDAEYDLETPPEPAHTNAQESRSVSQDSGRLSKRKSGVEEDEHILNNPELYGLRRSGRARPTRHIIESSSEDEDDVRTTNNQRRKKRRSDPSPKRTSDSQKMVLVASSIHVAHPDLFLESARATPAARASSTSDSDADEYGPRRHRKRKRSRHENGADSIPTHAEIRFSTRKAAKVTTYNEEDDDDLEDDEDAMLLTPSYGAGTEEDGPAIDVVLNHRLREGVESGQKSYTRDDFEYFIKWQGTAHYHATWETAESATACRGKQRLYNYFNKKVVEDIIIHSSPELPPEEKEKWSLDRESELDALQDYMKVERVIATRAGEEETEYYVKWKGLTYDFCTWETASLVGELAQTQIDRFLDRTSYLPVSNKTEANPATRSKHTPIREQPSYIKNGQLREFQITGLNFLAYNWCKAKNVILADEMGLGKTVQTVSFINWLRHDRQQDGPFIVVVPLSTMPSWAETFDHWTPDVNYVVYSGNGPARQIIRDNELTVDGNVKRVKFNVLLTTYEFIMFDYSYLSQFKWQFMAIDEAHRLKNRDSNLYVKLIEFKAPSRLLITGTPMQNTLGELSALMDFLMPGTITIEENMDLQSEAASQRIVDLTNAIQPYMLRRTKQKVENDIPPKSEKIIRVELSDVQLEYYKNILTKNYTALNAGAKGQKQSLLNIMMELKKASNHPFMLTNAENTILRGSERREDVLKGLITSSGKMMLLDQLLTKLKKDNHRVLIFSQMVRMLDILGDYLHLRGHQFQRLDGNIAAGPRRMAIDHFNAPESNDFCFLLSTRAGGLGINLMTADTVILFDSDWNPQADLQAMARAHRIGQKKPVSIYRLVSKGTVEEEVLERARNKLMLEFITIQRGVTDKDAQELSDKMAKVGRNANEPSSSDDISRILKRRGQKMFEQSDKENQKALEELDIDAVLENAEEHQTEAPAGMEADGGEEFLKSFEYLDVKIDLEWDEIIPKDRLDQIKNEEKSKADVQFLNNYIEENQPRAKRKAAMIDQNGAKDEQADPTSEPEEAGDERDARHARKRSRNSAAKARARPQEPEELDPNRPLDVKELRHLVDAYKRFGYIEDRGDEIVQSARLVSRPNHEILQKALAEIIEECKEKLEDEEKRIRAIEAAQNRPVAKKDKHAVTVTYNGVSRINADIMLSRGEDMRILRKVFENVTEPTKFRVPEASKGANYSCAWGAREDGMLLVGINKHGHGAWPQIRDDPDLGMSEKFFLDEQRVEQKNARETSNQNAKSPAAIHLVRRADYLISILREKLSQGRNPVLRRQVENHHRNNRKGTPQSRRLDNNQSMSASPGPAARRGHRDSEALRNRGGSNDVRRGTERPSSRGLNGHATPDGKRKLGYSSEEHRKRRRSDELPSSHPHTHAQRRPEGGHAHEDEQVLRELFRPVRESLRNVQNATKEKVASKADRAKTLRIELFKIGKHLRALLDNKDDAASNARLGEKLWNYVSTFWPNKGTPGDSLKTMYDRIAAADAPAPAAPKTTSMNGQTRPGIPVKTA
ncbi:MAG: hypothetical protein M4579_001062 [Chaenotheca gracillima]|nr:MAG: hypothetical protein M4579_001062 [Chaenotheca gracillima]